MRFIGLALAGMPALAAPIAAHAVPGAGKTGPGAAGPVSGIVNVWGGCGWGWHPVPGHWSQWRGGWVPPHCAPTEYRGGWGDPMAGRQVPTGVGVVMAAGKDPTASGAAVDGSLRDDMKSPGYLGAPLPRALRFSPPDC